jgi:hypothetical protein
MPVGNAGPHFLQDIQKVGNAGLHSLQDIAVILFTS